MTTMTIDQLKALIPKRHKFGATRVVVDGISFPSQREADRWLLLRMLEAQGKISALTRQVAYPLVMQTKYVADFVYLDEDGHMVIEDCKGFRTPLYERKKKLMRQQHGVEIKES